MKFAWNQAGQSTSKPVETSTELIAAKENKLGAKEQHKHGGSGVKVEHWSQCVTKVKRLQRAANNERTGGGGGGGQDMSADISINGTRGVRRVAAVGGAPNYSIDMDHMDKLCPLHSPPVSFIINEAMFDLFAHQRPLVGRSHLYLVRFYRPEWPFHIKTLTRLRFEWAARSQAVGCFRRLQKFHLFIRRLYWYFSVL